MRWDIEATSTLMAALAAIVVSIAVASRWLFVSATPALSASPAPVFVENWESALPIATHVAGDESAAVTVLTLMDLECPVCRTFHATALEVVRERAPNVKLLYVHFPLPYHRSALAAARVAECAREGEVDAFARLVDAVFAGQDSLGFRAWQRYARDAGLSNPQWIDGCAGDPRWDGRITAGLDFARAINARGTPTVVVNGWQFPRPPTREELLAAVDSQLTVISRS